MKFLCLLLSLVLACVLMAPMARAQIPTIATAPPTAGTLPPAGNPGGPGGPPGPPTVAPTEEGPEVSTVFPLYGTTKGKVGKAARNYQVEEVY